MSARGSGPRSTCRRRTRGIARPGGDARERVRAAAYVDFLENRERRFTEGFVMAEAERRASEPHLRLLAIFDAFDGSYRRDDCEGCSFINVTRSRASRTSS